MNALLPLLVLALVSSGTPATPLVPLSPGGDASLRAPPPHDLHVSYGNAVVEGSTVLLRLRLFKDDLEAALGAELGVSVLALDATPAVDRIFLRYLEKHLALEVGAVRLTPEVLGRGEELLDREPVWWYTLHYRTESEVTALRVRNTLLFDRFDDQRNVVKFVHLPEETQRTYAFARGEEVFTVEFGGG